jgi:hypothetical protein
MAARRGKSDKRCIFLTHRGRKRDTRSPLCPSLEPVKREVVSLLTGGRRYKQKHPRGGRTKPWIRRT